LRPHGNLLRSAPASARDISERAVERHVTGTFTQSSSPPAKRPPPRATHVRGSGHRRAKLCASPPGPNGQFSGPHSRFIGQVGISVHANETVAWDDTQSSAPAPSPRLLPRRGACASSYTRLRTPSKKRWPELRRGGLLQRPDPRATDWLAPRLGLLA
jgi:hypothetical protein